MKSAVEMLAEIMQSFRKCYFFLHNTKESAVVTKIMNEGFIFERQLSHSTDRINPCDSVEIAYFLLQRKEYGNYTVIIAIPGTIYDRYLFIADRNNVGIEEVISVTDPGYGDNDELVYTLPREHVLGFYDNEKSAFVQNSNWDPFFINRGKILRDDPLK